MPQRVTMEGNRAMWGGLEIGQTGKLSVAASEPLRAFLSDSLVYNLAPFPGGDVVIVTKRLVIPVERKRGDDLYRSWQSGHLAAQVSILLDCYGTGLLVVEEIDKLYDTGYYQPSTETLLVLQQDLVTYQEAGIHVLFSSDIHETARLVEALQRRYTRETHHALLRSKQPQVRGHLWKRVLCGIPSWGPETVDKALAALGNPLAVITATDEQLRAAGVPRAKILALRQAYGGHNETSE